MLKPYVLGDNLKEWKTLGQDCFNIIKVGKKQVCMAYSKPNCYAKERFWDLTFYLDIKVFLEVYPTKGVIISLECAWNSPKGMLNYFRYCRKLVNQCIDLRYHPWYLKGTKYFISQFLGIVHFASHAKLQYIWSAPCTVC